MDWALVVGVACYPDTDFGDLAGPELDARDFHAWVTTSGGIDPRQAQLILSSQFNPPFPMPSDGKPTADACRDFFTKLYNIAKANNSRVGQRLYLYFSGHGFMPAAREDEVGLLMANVEMGALGNHVLGRAWANLFYRSGYFREVLLFMDCCRNELKNTPLNEPFLTPGNDPQAKQDGRRFFAYATRWGRAARERKLPGGQSRGVFTAALLAGLRGAASDPATNEIRAAGLRSFLVENMSQFLAPEDLKNPDLPKTPDLYPSEGRDEDFVITSAKPTEFAVEIGVPANFNGQPLSVRDGKLDIVRTGVANGATWNVTLPIGLYLVQGPCGAEKKFQVVHPGFDAQNGVKRVDL